MEKYIYIHVEQEPSPLFIAENGTEIKPPLMVDCYQPKRYQGYYPEINLGPGCACNAKENPDSVNCAQLTIPQDPAVQEVCKRQLLGANWNQEDHDHSALDPYTVPGIGIVRLAYEGDHAHGDTGSATSFTSRLHPLSPTLFTIFFL